MKTQIITLAVILLFSLNVSAKTSSTNNNSLVGISEIVNASVTADEELNIENWMTNDYVWNLASSNLNVEETSIEEPLQVSDWMTNTAQWSKNASKKENKQLFSDNEQPLTIESWMTNDECWSL